MKTTIMLLCVAMLASCKTIKIQDSGKEINNKEVYDGYLYYPKQGEIYLSNIEDLIGNYVVIEPGPNNQAQTRALGRALTIQGKKDVKKNDLSQYDPPYKSRITGGFSIDLSFAVGSTSFKTDYVYDVILKKNNSATIPMEFNYIDGSQFNQIFTLLPSRFYALFFITGIEYRTLSYKEYIKASTEAKIGLTAIQVNGNVYYSNEQINSVPIIYYTGIIESMRFGDYNIQDSIYIKKQSAPESLKPAFMSIHPTNDLILSKGNRIKNLGLILKAKPNN